MSASSKNVDFSNVKDGGAFNRNRIPAGDYLAKVVKVEDAESKKDQEFQYLFTIQIQKRPSSKFPYYCKLTENQLWKLRNLLIAAGLSVPKARTKVDPNRVVGKLIGVTVEDDDYDGKEQSTIQGVFPAAELADGGDVIDDDGDDEGEEPEDDNLEGLGDDEAEEADEEPEAEEEEPEPALDRAALKVAIKKLKSDFVAKKSQTDEDLAALLAELEAQAAIKAKAASNKKKTTAKKTEVSDDELDELDIDDL